MKPRELKNLIQYIRNSYGKTMVSAEILDFLIGEVQQIPSEAVKWIQEQFLRRYPKCPEVLHSAIKDLWFSWRAENPDKCASDPYSRKECTNPNCYLGWMLFWRQDEFYGNRWIPIVVPCADCRRSRNTSITSLSYERCIERGWEPDSTGMRQLHQEEVSEIVDSRLESYLIEGREKTSNRYERAGI